MTHPILFLTDETGKRTGVVIAIGYYNRLLKKLEQLRGHNDPGKSSKIPVPAEGTSDERDRE